MAAKVLVLQHGIGWHAAMLMASKPVVATWAAAFGHTWQQHFDDIPRKPGDGMTTADHWGWLKIYVIKRAIEAFLRNPDNKITHVLWLDADATFQKFKDIAPIIDQYPQADIIVRRVGSFVLGGVMVFKVNQKTLDCLNRLWDEQPKAIDAIETHVPRGQVMGWYGSRYGLTEEIALTYAVVSGQLDCGDLPAEWHDCNPERDSADSGSENSIIRHFAFLPAETKLRRIQKAVRKVWKSYEGKSIKCQQP